MTALDYARPPADVEDVRGTLRMRAVCRRYDMSWTFVARALGVSKSAVSGLLSRNLWPRRQDPEVLRARLEALLIEAGAGTDELLGGWLIDKPETAVVTPDADADSRRASRKPAGALSLVTPSTTPYQPLRETDVLLPKQTLDMAARKAFRLFTNPFDAEVQSDAQMFSNAEIAFVREACWQAAVGGRFVALVSESGGGKTTIVQDLEARIQRDRKQVIVIRPSVLGMEDSESKGHQLKATDILSAIITTLQPLATVPQTLEARSKKASKLLGASIEAGFQHLLVIEEAHCLPDATLRHLKRLHELHMGRRPMLGILLVAQPELMLKLDPKRASLREVTQRCEIVQLMPLDGDLKAYLAHRAADADRQLAEFIDDAGVEAIRQRLTVVERPRSGGKVRRTSLVYPLAVNNWMTAALNTAASLGVPVVNADVVRAV